MAIKKKRNAFVRYFTPFGLRQICDFIMLAGVILLIVGLCTVNGVLLAGFICYALGAGLSLARCCLTLFSKKINHRDPVYKSAITNTVIMGVLFALALFGTIYTMLVM